MVFFPVPGANFDLASFSFQVPICGLAKQNVPAAKHSARVSSDVFVFIWPFQPGIGFAVNIFSNDAPNGEFLPWITQNGWPQPKDEPANHANRRERKRQEWRFH